MSEFWDDFITFYTLWTKSRRTCPTCKQSKPLTEFYPRRDSPIGVYTYCKLCTRKGAKWSYEKRVASRLRAPKGSER